MKNKSKISEDQSVTEDLNFIYLFKHIFLTINLFRTYKNINFFLVI